MTDDDFKAAFRSLNRVEPSADFLAKARSIPLRQPRADAEVSFWRIFQVPSRVATLLLSASFGLAIGYVTLDDGNADDGMVDDTELSAFLDLDTSDTLFTASADVEWDSP